MDERSFSGRGFRGAGNFPPKPVEVNKEYDVEIQEMSRRGEGIARIQGLVVFVPNTQNGDHVKIRVTRISRRFAEAEVVGKEEAEEKEEKLPEQKVEEQPEEEAEVVGKEEAEEKEEKLPEQKVEEQPEEEAEVVGKEEAED